MILHTASRPAFHPALIILLLGFTVACASAPAAGGPPDVPVTRRDSVVSVPGQSVPAASTRLVLDYSAGTFSHDLEQRTIISVGADSFAAAQDTLLTTASLTYSIERVGDSLRVTAMVDSLSVSSVRDTAGSRRLAAPVRVELEPSRDPVVTVPAPDSVVLSSCDSMEEAARAIAEDVHLRIPKNTQPRQRWSDSVSKVVCRGGIPMTAVTVSTFEAQDVQARSDSLILPIIRRSALTLAGSGTQGTRRITVSGTGMSETTFHYDLRAGAFLHSEGQSRLQLRFETIQQTEHVIQQSTSRVRRRILP